MGVHFKQFQRTVRLLRGKGVNRPAPGVDDPSEAVLGIDAQSGGTFDIRFEFLQSLVLTQAKQAPGPGRR